MGDLERGYWYLTTVKWPKGFFFMQESQYGVNADRWDGTPDGRGQFKFEKREDGTYKIQTNEWKDTYMYLDASGNACLDLCSKDPGETSYWNVKFTEIEDVILGKQQVVLLSTKANPDKYLYQATCAGSSSWNGNPGENGWFILTQVEDSVLK